MGNGKIVDIDPTKRLTKEAFDRIKQTVNNFEPDQLEGFLIIYKDREGGANLEAFGLDWPLLGISQAYLDELRRSLLLSETGDFDDDDDLVD